MSTLSVDILSVDILEGDGKKVLQLACHWAL